MSLDDMAIFVEVARARSFRRAAEVLGIPNSTLSRRMSALEAALGLRLLNRTTRKIELTEAGHMFFDRSQSIVDDARRVHEELAELRAQPSGLLRVSLPTDYALTYLSPIIAEFSRTHPGIRLELDLTSRNADMITEPFDLAVRMRAMPDSQMIVRLLTKLRSQVYASPDYLKEFGEPSAPTDLTAHQCLDFPRVTTWRLTRGSESVEIPIDGRVKSNSPGMARRLAASGLGLMLIPERLVADEVKSGQLRRVLPDWEGEPAPVFIVTESKLVPAKVRAFIAFLRAHVE